VYDAERETSGWINEMNANGQLADLAGHTFSLGESTFRYGPHFAGPADLLCSFVLFPSLFCRER
jgi:hypothetical protein